MAAEMTLDQADELQETILARMKRVEDERDQQPQQQWSDCNNDGLMILFSNIKFEKKFQPDGSYEKVVLGRGFFGEVYKATYFTSTVAVKRISYEAVEEKERLKVEARTLL
jgi:hypothetical protein